MIALNSTLKLSGAREHGYVDDESPRSVILFRTLTNQRERKDLERGGPDVIQEAYLLVIHLSRFFVSYVVLVLHSL